MLLITVPTSVSWAWDHARGVVYITTLDHVEGHVHAGIQHAQKITCPIAMPLEAWGHGQCICMVCVCVCVQKVLCNFHGTPYVDTWRQHNII